MKTFLNRFAIVALSFVCFATPASAAPFSIDGNVGLQAFVSLTDAHVGTTLNALVAFSGTAAARSGSWSEIEGALRAATYGNVPETLIYATPGGRYWVVGKGLQPVPIADRPYFAQVFSGKNAVGDLVMGRSSGKPVAIVAVPVRGANGSVTGLVGAAVDLTALNAILVKELGLQAGMVFWAVDARGVTALHSDPANIFNDVSKDPRLATLLKHMIATDSGYQTYTFKGKTRSVLFRHSALTGWTYGFGIVH
ncbi:MAG TPA: cache domain-containing protein [Candidatus Baltobacteraceae bacterium]|nr:cache domain-containing protein [Candidatus Baltobacteraceae bacterium]